MTLKIPPPSVVIEKAGPIIRTARTNFGLTAEKQERQETSRESLP
jgi:hypothetical protein